MGILNVSLCRGCLPAKCELVVRNCQAQAQSPHFEFEYENPIILLLYALHLNFKYYNSLNWKVRLSCPRSGPIV